MPAFTSASAAALASALVHWTGATMTLSTTHHTCHVLGSPEACHRKEAVQNYPKTLRSQTDPRQPTSRRIQGNILSHPIIKIQVRAKKNSRHHVSLTVQTTSVTTVSCGLRPNFDWVQAALQTKKRRCRPGGIVLMADRTTQILTSQQHSSRALNRSPIHYCEGLAQLLIWYMSVELQYPLFGPRPVPLPHTASVP